MLLAQEAIRGVGEGTESRLATLIVMTDGRFQLVMTYQRFLTHAYLHTQQVRCIRCLRTSVDMSLKNNKTGSRVV